MHKREYTFTCTHLHVQTQALSEAKHFKTHEDAIANIVLWMALITHIGNLKPKPLNLNPNPNINPKP